MKFDKATFTRLHKDSSWLWTAGDNGSWDGPIEDWESSHSKKYFEKVRGFNTAITAGANHGLHARFLADKFEHVFAFEPDPLSFFCMSNNVQAENVYKFQAALGEQSGLLKLDNSCKTNTGTYTVKETGALTIQCLTIDQLNLEACDLIQLDVEGYELKVIAGALSTILQFKPVIILENGHSAETIDYMSKLNYLFHERSVSDTIWIPNI